MDAFTRYPHDVQAPLLLSEDMIVSPQEQVRQFWEKLPETRDNTILHGILREWMTGCYDADLALRWVLLLTVSEPPSGVNSYEIMHRLARREFDSVRLPQKGEAA